MCFASSSALLPGLVWGQEGSSIKLADGEVTLVDEKVKVKFIGVNEATEKKEWKRRGEGREEKDVTKGRPRCPCGD